MKIYRHANHPEPVRPRLSLVRKGPVQDTDNSQAIDIIRDVLHEAQYSVQVPESTPDCVAPLLAGRLVECPTKALLAKVGSQCNGQRQHRGHRVDEMAQSEDLAGGRKLLGEGFKAGCQDGILFWVGKEEPEKDFGKILDDLDGLVPSVNHIRDFADDLADRL